MTTTLMELGSHVDSGESFKNRAAYLEALAARVTGESAVQEAFTTYSDAATGRNQMPSTD